MHKRYLIYQIQYFSATLGGGPIGAVARTGPKHNTKRHTRRAACLPKPVNREHDATEYKKSDKVIFLFHHR